MQLDVLHEVVLPNSESKMDLVKTIIVPLLPDVPGHRNCVIVNFEEKRLGESNVDS